MLIALICSCTVV